MNPDFWQKLEQSAPRLRHLLSQFHQPKVLVVGDLTLDEFLTGQTERISREAPVLIIRHETTKQVPGGGANAVYNLAKLGGNISVVGLIGDDDQGKVLIDIFQSAGIDTSGIVIDSDRPTVTKTRISAHARQSVTQQVVRIDRKSDLPPSPAVQAQLVKAIQDRLPHVDAVVCSDYSEGVMQSGVISAAVQHSLVIVDAQKDLTRYRGATIFTPNLPEAELALGYAISPNHLEQAGEDLRKLTSATAMLITRGEDGMSLFSASTHQHIPAFNRTEVFDVTGAGDTVVAALTLALANGGTFWESAVLGNLAASIVVRQFGTTTTSVPQMLSALDTLLNKNSDFFSLRG